MRFLQTPPEDTPFASMAPDGNEGFKQQLVNFVESEINPAITAYRDYLADEYLPQARQIVGVSALPNGEACYQASTEYFISASFSAEEIHQQGLDQMEVIVQQISELGERSLGTSDPAEILRIVKEDPQYRLEP